ncbi:integrase [gamma proteobacterium IMCC2047]|nr:integrase [gamma proteobacterium IMCC2047]
MTQNRFVFTKDKIEEIQSTGKIQRFYDEHKNAAGLMLQVTPKGDKSFCVRRRINGKPKTLMIERFNFAASKLERIRKRAAEMLSDLSHASSSEEIEKERKKITLEIAFNDYMDDRGVKSINNTKGLSERTISDYTGDINSYASHLKTRALHNINQRDISSLHTTITKKNGARTADRVCATLRIIFNYAKKRYTTSSGSPLFTSNPVDTLSATKSWNQPRAMRSGLVIQKENIHQWYSALKHLKDYKRSRNRQGIHQNVVCSYLFRFMLLTGLRPTEASELEKSQYNQKRKTISFLDLDAITRIKNAKNFELPLSDQAAQLLDDMIKMLPPDCKYIFPSESYDEPCSESIQRNWLDYVKKQTQIKATRKAARATFISIGRSLGIDPLVIKRLANHTAAGSSDVTDGYTTSEQEVMREAAQKIAELL